MFKFFKRRFNHPPLPPLNTFAEFQDHPERFDLVRGTGEDGLPVLRAQRRSTGELVAEQTWNPFDQIRERRACFDFVPGKGRTGISLTRIVRKLNGEVVAEEHHFGG